MKDRKDTVSYNTSMTLCTRSGELEKSLALYAEMTAQELRKDRFTYSAAVKAGPQVLKAPESPEPFKGCIVGNAKMAFGKRCICANIVTKNKADPRTRMHSTKNQSKILIIDLGQRQESATSGNDVCRLLSSLILVDKSCQRLLSTTRVNNMRRKT